MQINTTEQEIQQIQNVQRPQTTYNTTKYKKQQQKTL